MVWVGVVLICCDVVEIVLVGNMINDYGNIEPLLLCNKSKFVAFLAVMSFYVVVYITTHMSHVTYMWVNTYQSTSTNYATYANPPPPPPVCVLEWHDSGILCLPNNYINSSPSLSMQYDTYSQYKRTFKAPVVCEIFK